MVKGKKFSKPVLIIIEVILISYAVSLVFPYVWVLVNSFKSVREFYANPTWKLPKTLNFTYFVKAIQETNIFSYFKNSIVITIIGTVLQIMFSAMTAYVLAKYKFRGCNLIFALAIGGFLLPSTGTLAPLYVFLKKTGLFNSGGLLIMYASGMGSNMIIFYSFFKRISWSYAEAAFVDGASDFQVFRKIMFPMAREATIAVSIITAIRIWNDYFIPSIVLTDEKYKTVAVGLRSLQVKQEYAASWTTLFAAVIIATVPTIAVYIAFQDKIYKGFLFGGLKE